MVLPIALTIWNILVNSQCGEYSILILHHACHHSVSAGPCVNLSNLLVLQKKIKTFKFSTIMKKLCTIHIQLSKVQTFEHVTIMPLLNRRCRTASQWCISVFTISPEPTSHTRTVESLEPLMITLSSYCRHNTEPVWPVSTWEKNYYYDYNICKYLNSMKVLWIHVGHKIFLQRYFSKHPYKS